MTSLEIVCVLPLQFAFATRSRDITVCAILFLKKVEFGFNLVANKLPIWQHSPGGKFCLSRICSFQLVIDSPEPIAEHFWVH